MGAIFLTSCNEEEVAACTETVWYEDADGDGLGNPDVSQMACEQPTGFVANADDSSDDGLLSVNESFFNSSGIYDGDTNPGFQVLKRSLWEAMEADGFDIVDADGNITIVDPGAGGGGPGAGGVTSACLEAAPDDDLVLTFLIPVTPELLSTPNVIGTVENIGVSVDGIPLTGDPPSVATNVGGMPGGGGAIPSIDPCGGHMDPSGYYHLHFAPEEMNNVLDAHGITEISCTNFEQSETALVGFAKDGFPIYASREADGTLPTDLDDCGGHFGPTPEFPNGTYHYHASSSLAPNVPPCLVGASVRNSFTFQ